MNIQYEDMYEYVKKINIDDRYLPSEEIRSDDRPYIDYYNCLKETFNINSIDGIADFGCTTGCLLKIIKVNHPNQRLYGVEYFEWQKEASNPIIKEQIEIADLRDSLNHNLKYDIVNCTEVGEHIEAKFTGVLLDNIKKIGKRYAITTWSKGGGTRDPAHDPHQQHLNPLDYDDYIRLFESYGFRKNWDLTNKFIRESLSKPNFYFWWRDSLVIWDILTGEII